MNFRRPQFVGSVGYFPNGTRIAFPGRLHLAALALLIPALVGCQGIESAGGNTVQVRFIDAAAETPRVDVYQNKSGLAFNLEFGTVTSYVPLPAGRSTLLADAAGSHQTLTSTRQTMVAGKQYTAIFGNVAGNLRTTIYADQSRPAPFGQVSVRVISQVTRATGLDVYLVPSSSRLPTTAPLAINVLFGTNVGYVNVPVGTYSLAVVPTGTVPLASTVTLLTGTQTAYTAGSVRTVVLIDAPVVGAPAVRAVVATDYDSPSTT